MSLCTALLRRIVPTVTVAIFFTFPQIALAQCLGIREEGRWRNPDITDIKSGEPTQIEVKTIGGCGDQMLNGQQSGSSPRYQVRIWFKVPNGKSDGLPLMNVVYNQIMRSLYGNLATGGDLISLEEEKRDGSQQLHVVIKHLKNGKVHSQSEYWFIRSR